MQEALNRLVSDLNRREIIDWLPDMKLGRPAYDRIRAAVEHEVLTVNQLRNGFHALFRLKDHATDQEVFDLFVRFTEHADERVRSEALQLAIGLIRFHRSYPMQPLVVSERDTDAFRRALALGVSQKVAALARDYLDL
jgi:hypothetical protein